MKKISYIILFVVILIVSYLFLKPYISPKNDDYSVSLQELNQLSKLQYTLTLDIAEVSSAKTYKIIGGGNLVLPSEFKNSEDPEIIIVHGINSGEIEDFVNSTEFEKMNESDRTVIITSLALGRYLINEKNNIFKKYLDNFKKTGDIFNSDGEIFYYLDKLVFMIDKKLSGLVFSFPEGSYFSNVKNFGLAHLIQNDFSLEGLERPIYFLEGIEFPKPKGFNGSFNDLILEAKENFHAKYYRNIIEIDYKQGKIVPNKILPIAELNRPNQILPLIKSMKLSKNSYFSGLNSN